MALCLCSLNNSNRSSPRPSTYLVSVVGLIECQVRVSSHEVSLTYNHKGVAYPRNICDTICTGGSILQAVTTVTHGGFQQNVLE